MILAVDSTRATDLYYAGRAQRQLQIATMNPFSHQKQKRDAYSRPPPLTDHPLHLTETSAPSSSQPVIPPPPLSNSMCNLVVGVGSSSERFESLLGSATSSHWSSGEEPERSRGFRHMMRERQRRESLSQSYAELHYMLPSRSKSDKISIVQTAGEYLRELLQVMDKLRRRNRELQLMVSGNVRRAETAPIKVCAGNCSSPVDSTVAALHCLKQMEVRVAGFRSRFDGRDLAVEVVVETEENAASAEVVERAMRDALMLGEVEHCIVP